MNDNPNIVYLGDGAYAEFDGYGVWLRAYNYSEFQYTDQVYLKPEVLHRLDIFYNERMEAGKEWKK